MEKLQMEQSREIPTSSNMSHCANIIIEYLKKEGTPQHLAAVNQILNPNTQLQSTKECVYILDALFEAINEKWYEIPIKDTFKTKNTIEDVLLGIIIYSINEYTCHNQTLKLISNLSLKDAQSIVNSLINAIYSTK
jgi:hypothetical protein